MLSVGFSTNTPSSHPHRGNILANLDAHHCLNSSIVRSRTTRQAGYKISQTIRKRIEEAFGWGKTVGPFAKTMLRGLERVGFPFKLTVSAYNLARLPRLLAA